MELILTLLPHFSLFLLSVTLLVAGAPYNPTDMINLINCGSSGVRVDLRSRNWTGDVGSNFSPTSVGGASQVSASPSSDQAPEVPFGTARLSLSEFTYRIPVTPGHKFIRLYFFPATYNSGEFDRFKSLFSVKLQGYNFTLLKDFNASIQAKADHFTVMIREFMVSIEPEKQTLNITFTASRGGYAFVNGIEIMPMPPYLYYTDPSGEMPKILTGNTYQIEKNTAMETMYRINVGGEIIPPDEDTGMYRTWDATDILYLDDKSKSNLFVTAVGEVRIQFSGKVVNYTAPEKVYKTARSMGLDKTINRSYNLTWTFGVHPQFNYLVRLHFCEIVPYITKPGDRRFHIFIADEMAEKGADVIEWTGGNGIPVYKDYIVFAPRLASTKTDLVEFSIVLQAGGEGFTKYSDAILNGVEILKLSDTYGNLAGPNPNQSWEGKPSVKPPMSSTKPKKKLFPMLAIVAGVFSVFLVVFVVGFLLCMHGRKSPKGYVNSTSKASKWGPFSFSATTKSSKSRGGGSSLPSDLCRHFSLAEIISATENFNPSFIIGVGGFGNVYKGHIDDRGASIPVAIKRLKPESSQGAVEFKTEIDMLSQLRHLHLVSLVGTVRTTER